MTIRVDETASEQAGTTAVAAAICAFELHGHDWHDITAIGDLNRKYVCGYCNARGKDDETLRINPRG